MPGMDGLQVARNIKDNYQDDATPIVLMITAFSRDELLQQPDIHNVDGILNKPVTSSSLYNTVVDILHRRGANNLDNIKTITEQKKQRILGVRVLIVDDSEINREVAMRILVGEGGVVHLANDGREAVNWLQANPNAVDIVLMDVQMPVMDGYEATIQLRKNPKLASLPIIALTAGAFKSQQDAANSAGMNAFVAKPFNVDELLSAIQKLTGTAEDTTHQYQISSPSPIFTNQPDLPGIDLSKGLSIWNDVNAYKKFLRKFIDEYKDSSAAFRIFYMEKDITSAKTLAHKIKGAAGNLALVGVAESANKLETAQDDNWNTQLSNYEESLKAVIASVDLFAGTTDNKRVHNDNRTVASPDTISAHLNTLLSALDKDTPDQAFNIIASLEKMIDENNLSSIKKHIDDFDFRGAEECVRTLIAQYQH